LARVERPLAFREGTKVVVVGGSTLGGSGKTPLAMACAEALSRNGTRVALVGHAHAAVPGRARRVSPDDDVRLVGDEAIVCARRLSPLGIEVVVAPTRQAALGLALERADVAVVDGVGQTRPRRATLALLALDAADPWGAGSCPPRGDLKAPTLALLAAADRVVLVGEGQGMTSSEAQFLPLDRAEVVSQGARLPSGLGGELLAWDALRPLRLGLWTALARPQRVLRDLLARGVIPEVTWFGQDHRPSPPSAAGTRLDLWLTTHKCGAHRGGADAGAVGGVPVATLDHALRLENRLEERLSRLDPRRSHP